MRTPMEKIDVVIPSAGSGLRVAAAVAKQFSLLGKVPMIVHPLRVFQSIAWVRKMIVVHGRDQQSQMEMILHDYGFPHCQLVEGGATRQESVRRGLALVTTSRVIVHNAAVALVTRDVIERVAEIEADCVTTATPVEVNMVRGEEFAEVAVPKDRLKVINSPQCFRTAVLRECHQRALEAAQSFASDAELMLHYKKSVRLVPGPARNFKITTPFDLLVAEAILAKEGAPDLSHSIDDTQL